MTPPTDLEKLRKSFKPQSIKTLFVGESAPSGGTFFYLENSNAYRYMKKAFGCPDDFLNWFKAHAFYLDDLVPFPIDDLQKESDRRRAHDKHVSDLAGRIRTYDPATVVCLLRGIDQPVQKALEASGSQANYYCVRFPGNGQQNNFLADMNEILPSILEEDMPELGNVSELKLSAVFAGEASEFTPWLHKNLEHLATKLGFELEPDDTEVSVGSFKLDIRARASDGRLVVIENQFERTDHTHLGQLLTYAAGLDAKIIIWISENVRDEHRAAIDWLNDKAEGADFFAVEAKVAKIDGSLPAIFWDVVSSPNTWTRAGGPAKSISSLTPGEQIHRSYWEALNSMIDETGSSLTKFKPDGSSFQGGSIGRTDFGRYSTTNSQSKRIRVEIYIEGPLATERFEFLQSHREKIEEELGYKLHWDPLETKRACRISYALDADPRDQEDWDRQHRWLIDRRTEFERVFRPYAKELPS